MRGSAPGQFTLSPASAASSLRLSVIALLPLHFCLAHPASAQLPYAVNGADLANASGEAIYANSCANCHGLDGTGVEPSLLAFEEEMPDFTDCDFAAREPDGDWIAVAHEGGPVRGFSEMMPAFRGALTVEQLERTMGYIRSLCTDDNWPRGELNLPRPLLTTKAYPEDEWVVEAGVDLEGDGAAMGAYVYERRYGPRSQVEVVIPYGWRGAHTESDGHDHAHGSGEAGRGGGHGLGDIVLGVKHALYHSSSSGTIFSLGGEVFVATGDEEAGLGAPGNKLEAYASLGQILPNDAFIQAQGGVEAPLYEDAANEVFGRFVLGATFTEGDWGRAWTPMVEVQAKHHLESGAETEFDLIPQVQVALNTRQHVLGNIGVLVPLGSGADEYARPMRLVAYVLLDWFDGGFFEGW